MYEPKSVVDILPILDKMVRKDIWGSWEEAVEEYKLRRERRHTVGLSAAAIFNDSVPLRKMRV